MASITYTFTDSSGFLATCTITEDGLGGLVFTIEVDESTGQTADLRGLFFDLNNDDPEFLSTLSVSGADITDQAFEQDSVVNLGNGDNVNGSVVNETGLFDAGVEIGTQGISKDDIQCTTFTLSSSLCDLTLDMIANVDTALRCTSSGDVDGSRNGSLKLVGDISSGTISGSYFWDQDGNDVDNAGDTSIVGKWVTLLMADGTTPALDTAGNAVAAVQTDVDGRYMFNNLAAGDYVVMFQDSTAEGLQFVTPNVGADEAVDSDVDPATGRTGLVTVVAGYETTDVDAGVKAPPAPPPPPASISGRYFDDANGNGIDDGEAGVEGRTVTLLDADGQAVATTVTGADGSYGFEELAAGTYSVEFQATDGKVFSAQDIGGDDSVNSDVDPATGRTDAIVVSAGVNITDVDAGVMATGGGGGGDTPWDLTGAIQTETHSLTYILDASFTTYDWFLGIPPVDVNGDGINNVVNSMLAEVIDRAQTLAADQKIDLILAGADGVAGQQSIMAGALHGLDPHGSDIAVTQALQALFGPTFYQPAGLPDQVDFASALNAAGSTIQAGYGATGAMTDEVVVLTTSDGIDPWTLQPAFPGSAEASQALAATLGASVDVVLIESLSFDWSVLTAMDTGGAIDTYSSMEDDPWNPATDPYHLGTLVSDSPAVTEGDIIGLLIGGQHIDLTDPTPGDGRIDVSLTGLEGDPADGIGIEIDTNHDGVADTVVTAALDLVDGVYHFEVGPFDLLV